MAIFETLSIIFKADSSQLKKEVDDVKKKTGETTDVLKDVEDQTKKTDNQFVGLAKTLTRLATAYFSVGAIVSGFKSSMAHTTEISNFSRELDLPVEKLDALGKAIKNFGGDANAFNASLKQLAFDRFNSNGQAALDFLIPLGDIIKQRFPDAAQAQIYLQQELGLDAGTAAFIHQGSEAIRAAIAEQERLGVVSAEDVEIQTKFNDSIGKLSDSFDSLIRKINDFLLPKLGRFVDILTGFVNTFTFGDILEEERKNTNEAKDAQNRILKSIFGGFNLFDQSKEPTYNLLGGPENKDKIKSELDFTTDYGYGKYQDERDENGVPVNPISDQSYYVPTHIPQVTNSQARSLSVNAININATEKEAKAIGSEVLAQLDEKSQFFNSQLQQSNAYFDNAVVI